jgi:tyrosyl-tRNA synthetase
LIQGGGLKVNYEKCEQADFALSPQHLLEDTFLIVQKGKKNYFVIKAV